jgi:hypothetical protein
MADTKELVKALRAIAEGYSVTTWCDNLIGVENPDYMPDDGSNPRFVIDAAGTADALERLERERDEALTRDDPAFVHAFKKRAEAAEAEAATLRARVARLEAALIWYENNVAGCRLIHSGGDAHRNALSKDGGTRARDALKESQP